MTSYTAENESISPQPRQRSEAGQLIVLFLYIL